MLKRLLTWDGHDISSSSDIRGILPADGDYARSVSLAVTSRPGLSPTIDSFSLNVLDIPLVLARAANAGITTATFVQTVESWFPVGKRAILRGYAADGQTVVEVECVVSRAGMRPRRWVFDVVLTTESGAALGSSVSSGTGPSTVNNTGSQPVAPIIALTTTTHVSYRSTTVTGAGAGGGLIAYPIVLAQLNTLSGNRVYAYVQGVSVPILVIDGGADYIYALVDTHSDGTTATQIDIYYGASLPLNPLANTLQSGGGDWDGPSFSNTSWSWDTFAGVLSNPARCGSWRAALFGNHNTASNSSYRVSTSSTTAICAIGAQGEFDNSADSVVMVVGAQAGNTNALTNLARTTANLDGTNARAFVRYRVPGSATWQDAWTTRSNASVTTSIDLDGAVEIAAGIENDGATNDPATLTLGPNGASNTALALQANPTVTAATVANADYYNGAYTIGEYTITFNDVVCPDGTLTIDCAARTISSSADGPIYGSFSFSHPDEWAVLQPGSNAISDGLGASDTVSYRPAHG